MSDELKPCPFCGGAAELVRSEQRFEYGTGGPYSVMEWGYYVFCAECGAGTDAVDIPPPDEDAAIDAWNNRAQPQAYAHRNGETDEPMVAGWYWFDGKELFPPQHVIKRLVLVEREEDGGSVYWYGAENDERFACADGWLKGQWWGPVTPPWLAQE